MEIINSATTVYIAKGKKFIEFDPNGGAKEEILKNALGRSGTLRAPTFKVNDKVIIGFNEELYEQQLIK